MVWYIIDYIYIVVETDPSFECSEYILFADFSTRKRFDSAQIERLKNLELLGVKSLPGSLSLSLIHHKFCVINLCCDIFQSFEVNIEQLDILRLIRSQCEQIVLDRILLQGDEM